MKSTNLSLEKGDLSKGATAGSGLNATGKSDSLPETDGIRLFMMNPEDGADLFGEQQFEGVGTEVEDGSTERGIRHT